MVRFHHWQLDPPVDPSGTISTPYEEHYDRFRDEAVDYTTEELIEQATRLDRREDELSIRDQAKHDAINAELEDR